MKRRPSGLSIKDRILFLIPAAVIVLCHNLIKETTHCLAALAYAEPVREFRFLTNGLGSSQVVFASPVEVRTGAHWPVIAWAPSIVTTLIGYILYLNRGRFVNQRRAPAIIALYAGFFFLLLDPFYLSIHSLLVGGDIGAAAAVGWSAWLVRGLVLPVVIFNLCLYFRWLREQSAKLFRRAT